MQSPRTPGFADREPRRPSARVAASTDAGRTDRNAGLLGPPGGLRRRVARHATWSVAGAVVSRGFGLASTLVAAGLLVPRQFGRLSLVEATVLLLGEAAALGLRVAATKRVAETRSVDRTAAGRYVGFVLALNAATGTVVAIAVAVASRWIAGTVVLDRGLAPTIGASAGVVLFASLSATTAGVLAGLEAFATLALLQTIEGLLAALSLVTGILVSGLNGGIVGWMVGEGVAAATGVALVLRACRRRGVPVRFDRRRADWAVLRRIGVPALAASLLVQAALLGAQRALAARASGLSQVAAFNVAYRWQLVVLFVPSALAPVVLPVMAHLRATGEVEDSRRVFRANLVANVVLVVLASLLVLGVGPQLLTLTGRFYAAQTRVLDVLLVATVPVVVNNVLSQAALALDQVAAWVWSDVGLAVALFGAALLFVPSFGAVGLGLAYLAGYVVTCVVLVGPVRAHLVPSPAEGSRCASP